MKALAFKQPWAFAVLFLGKNIDNRRRKDGRMPNECHHRGPLLIHASARPTSRYVREAFDWIVANTDTPRQHLYAGPSRYPCGGIVGRCNVIAHVDPLGNIYDKPGGNGKFERAWPADDPRRTRHGIKRLASGLLRWQMPDSYALVLAEIEPVHACEIVPWNGAQGIFNVDLNTSVFDGSPL